MIDPSEETQEIGKIDAPPRQLPLLAIVFSGILVSPGAALAASDSEEATGVTLSAAPGIIEVPAAELVSKPLTFAGGVGYGWYPEVPDQDGTTHRVAGRIAGAWGPLPELLLRVAYAGRAGVSPASPEGTDVSYYGEPHLGLRLQTEVLDKLLLGADGEAILVGSDSNLVVPSALVVDAQAIVTYHLASQTLLSFASGYRSDHSANGVAFPSRLRPGDRLLLEASSWDAVHFGLGFSQRWLGTELLVEAKWSLLLGTDPPGIGSTPWHLGWGARRELGAGWSVLGSAKWSGTVPETPLRTGLLVPVPPTGSLELGLAWQWDRAAPKPPDRPLPKAPEAILWTVSGQIVDEGGRPIPEVQVALRLGDGRFVRTKSSADGRYRVLRIPSGNAQLRLEKPGLETLETEVFVGGEHLELDEIVLYAVLPDGQVKGRTLDAMGRPVVATITIEATHETITSAEDGSFSANLRPGTYSVRIYHPDFATQRRVVTVNERGVVVLDVILTK